MALRGSGNLMVVELTPEEVHELLRTRPDTVVLLDIREPSERRAAAILPSIHIPMQQLGDRLADIPRDRQVIVYCHMGGRSSMVAGFLEAAGFPDVANLEGGIDGWSLRVDPDVARYG